MRQFKIFLALTLFVSCVSYSAVAETSWVQFQVGGDTVKALIALPSGQGPHAAVIYNHGSVVREKGYKSASARGYDPADYVQALADAGYVGLAPIREHLTSSNYRTAVIGGVETVKATIRYLKGRSEVKKTRIGAIGFSEGGLVTLWSAIEGAELSAIVLMSPATIQEAGDKQLKVAASTPHLARLTMPLLLTVGTNDNRSIRKVTERRLIPNMEKLGMEFTYKTDYPGDHKWFWKVRPDHFGDVIAFLAKHLK
ncbi:MAG: dienelactone hydrolase family protein [Rhodospirillales bacterium]|nr:dienelactone hydrolase family protein [Rhodospirillales bacterium]